MWERVGAGLHSCSGAAESTAEQALNCWCLGPLFSWLLRKSHLTSGPTLLIFKVDVIPPAPPCPSVAGRINWANGCEEGSISGRWVVTCWSVPIAGGSGFQLQPLSQPLRTKVRAQVLETVLVMLAQTLTNLERVLACQQGGRRKGELFLFMSKNHGAVVSVVPCRSDTGHGDPGLGPTGPGVGWSKCRSASPVGSTFLSQ